MKNFIKLTPIVLMMLLAFASCDDRNIQQVIKEIAEAPVDTTGMQRKSILTSAFSSIYIDCFADVTYHQIAIDDVPRVELKAIPEILEQLKVDVDDNELAIGINRRYRMPEKAVIVIDVYAPYVSRVISDGTKCIRLGQMKMSTPLEVDMEGIGALVCDSLYVPELLIAQSGAGSVHLKGLNLQKLNCLAEKSKGTLVFDGITRSSSFKLSPNCQLDTTSLVVNQLDEN